MWEAGRKSGIIRQNGIFDARQRRGRRAVLWDGAWERTPLGFGHKLLPDFVVGQVANLP